MQRREFIDHLEVLFTVIQGKAVKALMSTGRFASSTELSRQQFLSIYKKEWTLAKNDVQAWMSLAGVKSLHSSYAQATRLVYALANSLASQPSISPRSVQEATTELSIQIAHEIGSFGYSTSFMAFLEAYCVDKCKRALRHPSDGKQYSVREFALFQERMAAVIKLDKSFIIGELLKDKNNLLTTDGLRDYLELVAIISTVVIPHLIRSLRKAKDHFSAVIEATVKYYIPQIQTGKIRIELFKEESDEEKRRKKEAEQIASVNEMIYGVKSRKDAELNPYLFYDPLAGMKKR